MNRQIPNNKPAFKRYWPLITLIGVSALTGVAINLGTVGTMREWMHYFIGIFLVIFATLKIFNLGHFADGFQMYDLIAKRSRIYAYCYPFIELCLGMVAMALMLLVL